MSLVAKLSSQLGRRDEVPNQELAKLLASSKNTSGIREIAQNLWNDDKAIRADCIKVLYEIGYIDPGLIDAYWQDYLKLLRDRNNRLAWGAMIALSVIADLRAKELFEHWQEIRAAMAAGSVITRDGAVITLSKVAASGTKGAEQIFPYLLEYLRTCRPKEVPAQAERMLVAVNSQNQAEFRQILEARYEHLSSSGQKRVDKLFKTLG